MTSALRHAQLVAKRAGKGCKRSALAIVKRLMTEQLRREVEARRVKEAA